MSVASCLTSSEMPDELELLAGFGNALRAAGVAVDTTRMLTFCEAASELAGQGLYWPGRLTLVAGKDDIPTYDAVFFRYFGTGPTGASPTMEAPDVALSAPQDDGATVETSEPQGQVGSKESSRHEFLRECLLASCEDVERELVARLRRRLMIAPPSRRVRRQAPARLGALDLRRTARRSFRTGGEPVWLARRARVRLPRRGVLIIDVSGSMTQYARPMLLLGAALVGAGLPWRVICFGTRVTEVTDALRARELDAILAGVAAVVPDYDGGTRIGTSLTAVLGLPDIRSHLMGAVAVVHSDGLEIGSPAELATRMADLSRLTRHIVWCNPYRHAQGYEPTAAGMQAAVPYLHGLLGDDPEQLLEYLAAL
jgi:uncharacterized protein with von Willebrand factor type A (vWA) domain